MRDAPAPGQGAAGLLVAVGDALPEGPEVHVAGLHSGHPTSFATCLTAA